MSRSLQDKQAADRAKCGKPRMTPKISGEKSYERRKDRFGEKFVERAEEDHYFAAKDRALIDEMKVEFQKAEPARRKDGY